MSLFNVLGQAGQVSQGFSQAEATARQAQLDALRVREAERLSQMYERAAQEAPRMYAPIATQPVGGGLAIPQDYMTRYAPVAVAPTAAAPATAAGVDAQLKAPVVEAPKQAPSETFSRELNPSEAAVYSFWGVLPKGVTVSQQAPAQAGAAAEAKPTGPVARTPEQKAARPYGSLTEAEKRMYTPETPEAQPRAGLVPYAVTMPPAQPVVNQPQTPLGAVPPPEAPPMPKAAAQAAPATGKAAVQQQQQVTQSYLANPESITVDMRNAMSAREQLAQRRNDFARLAFIYQTSGTAEGLRQAQSIASQLYDIDSKIMEADNNMYYLQGMQGIQEVQGANDPRRLAAVMSHYMGVPVAYQPRTDGTYNVWINNKLQREGVPVDEVISEARSNFDESYVKSMAKRAEDVFAQQLENEGKVLTANLDLQKFIAQQPYEIGKERDKIISKLKADGILKLLDVQTTPDEVKVSTIGDNRAIVTVGSQSFIYDADPGAVMVNGQPVQQAQLRLLKLQ